MPHATQLPDITQKHGDWRHDLFQNGYAIIKNAVPASRAAEYVESMTQWLEKFPLGFDRKDPSTWTEEHLPAHMKGGMYHSYSISHEKFVWDARLEPGILNTFSKIWDTDELLVSFDGISITLPLPESQRKKSGRWPHQDQNFLIRGFQCAQGILNLAPNDDWHGFSDDEVDWFKARGCEEAKLCAEAGDLIVWDSRTVHFNVLPEGDNVCAVIYACYTPAALATPEGLEKKKEIFERERTTHWPHRNFWRADEILRFGKKDPYSRDRPFEEPILSEKLLKLAGAMPYTKANGVED
ncbi:hypothetical protein N431DRAFT_510519 [Stipitochalara longipes BDJ]|nr:hypothetical protein N431DRAFT_510519 [Stipitochalara longipes BDJ]